MDAILYLLALAGFYAGGIVTCIQASSYNKRKLAAWLLASAKAQDEKEAAIRGIRKEQLIYQRDLEKQFKVGGPVSSEQETPRVA